MAPKHQETRMQKASLELLIRGLNDAGVRYLLVGGLAVNAHGYLRSTVDVDLIVQLDPANLLPALGVLKSLGYTPRVPVPIESFADPELRLSWIRDKNMKVFSLRSDQHPETEVDLFADDPLGFDNAYGRAMQFDIAAGLWATVCALDDLLELKRQADRDKDRNDIQKLKEIHDRP